MRVILASASPRRQELLTQIGVRFEVRVSHVEEKSDAVTSERLVEELSGLKAQAVLWTVLDEAGEFSGREPLLVIGADTVVSVEGRILGKPGDAAEAVEMLELLAGGSHQVCTGVTLLYCGEDGKVAQKVFHETTRVEFYPMSEEETAAYVATGDPLDKAGAYGIQGICARYIKGIEGDYNNVVGLPVGRLYQEMREWLSEGESAQGKA